MTSPNAMKPEKRICLGKIAAPHGVKGLVKILAFGEDPKLLETLCPLYTGETGDKTISLSLKNQLGKFFLAQIDGCCTREGSDAIKGTELWVLRSSLPELDQQNEFYIEDLAKLKVLNDKGEEIGIVFTVQNYGAGDLLEIKPSSGASYFVPFKDEYVRNIDLCTKTLVIEDAAEMFRIE